MREQDTDAVVRGSWNGRVELRRGSEGRTYLEVANSSAGEVVFEGAWLPLERR